MKENFNYVWVSIALFPLHTLCKGCALKTLHLHSCTEEQVPDEFKGV